MNQASIRNRAQEEQDIVVAALKQLSNQERVILGLYVYEGLNVEEIAEVLNQSSMKVTSWLQEIFKKIQLVHVENDPYGDLVNQIFG